jgi:protein-L-isoaspartate(D-aspartate) O-methyltransferase
MPPTPRPQFVDACTREHASTPWSVFGVPACGGWTRVITTLLVLSTIISCVTAGEEQDRAGGGQAAAGWEADRFRMVAGQIRARGVDDERVLSAMAKVPRHLFVPPDVRARAYDDTPLPIGFDQTISQPYIVAYMSEVLRLEPNHKVLEIGTGSGYQTAILAELAREVYTIEIVEPLAARARETISELGYRNVQVRHGNGYLGWPEAAPFDRIIVTAAPEDVPQALVDQLAMNGLLVVPVGRVDQTMTILRKTPQGIERTETLPVRFVPMVGKDGVK